MEGMCTQCSFLRNGHGGYVYTYVHDDSDFQLTIS